ncbi:sugar kinase [Rhizobium halophytocola]|uniref:2-dehydro-3-deoxygluconokinase n=1 Tax=Rhizobium halophytocola TaxID=735519 RepID=A0ABS4DTN5_9HYPH|nr:sugar kinase [Rhizobium halophytocola]MBP1849059.1 2-dehydro-3-deoxygluconokinase [Rhizobium halophytocola]
MSGQGRFVSIGECMVEMAPRADGAYQRNFAGDTFNTAWYMAKALGEEGAVEYFTAVGADEISTRMLAFMAQSGVGTSAIRRLPERTVGLYMIELVNGERSFSYWRGQSAAKLLAEDRAALAAALADREMILFSGITLAVLSAEHRTVLLKEIETARDRGARIVFDPNMRARLWPNGETMRDAITAAGRVADIVLPSFDEEEREFGDADPAVTLRRYQGLGVDTVVVKNGAGAIHAAVGPEHLTFQPAVVTEVVDTTAAGDSFNAGFLSALLRGERVAEAIAAGSRLAAQVVGQRGALVEVSV